jgi:GT2 family glycosyltransferase/glycosyltransferase involved in cell wall biosynthesis
MRGLMCLGVDPGPDLLPPVSHENPRGFFEDEPMVALSDRVLASIGLRWDSIGLIQEEAWRQPDVAAHELEAVRSIRERFDGIPTWGFKNPRTARLLPFWRRVFGHLGRDDAYLIVVRNPISVARSLAARNGIGARRAHVLWLLHMTESVLHTRGRPRVCIDYDDLVDDPARQLDRVAGALGLPTPDSVPEAVDEFTERFLSDTLRNSRYAPADLELDATVSTLASSAYATLLRWARDDDPPSAAQLQRGFGRIHAQLRALEPVLAEADDLEERRRALELDLAERGHRIHALQLAERERSERLDAQKTALASHAERIATLEESLREATARVDDERARTEQESARARDERARAESKAAEVVAAASEAARLRAERNARQQRLEEIEAALETARQARLEAERTRAASEEALREARDELEAAGARHDSLLAEAAALRSDVERLRDTTRRALRSAESAARSGEARSAALEAELREARARADEQRESAEALERALQDSGAELEGVRSREEALRAEVARWVHRDLSHLTRRLVDAADALERTRTWRLAALGQRAMCRLRRRPWVDGAAQLRRVAGELHRQAGLGHGDARFLAQLADDVRTTVLALTSGEIFRLSRTAARARRALMRRGPEDGPIELLRNRAGELAFHFQHLAESPFAAAETMPAETGTEELDVAGIVDVVVPVHDAREATLRCLDSVFEARNSTPFEVVVVDDASRDRALVRALDELEQEGRIRLLRNPTNLGFPSAANRGMALHPDRDVVILNSDTRVHGSWLDRLRTHATGDWRVATVTPLSNNAEICSYPELCRSHPMPDAAALAELDEAAAEANAGHHVALPTAVGFCTYIRRQALREVGSFDVRRFARGYGEENDFSLRARAHGYQHLLATDVFVAHEGGASFSTAKEELIARGLRVLDELYPGYHAEVQSFIAADPVRAARRRIDARRLGVTGPTILLVTHALGGGTARHVRELAAHLAADGIDSLLLSPASGSGVRLSRPGGESGDNLVFDLPRELDSLTDTLRRLDVRHVHVHHTLGIDDTVHRLPSLLGVQYDVTLHDYAAVCPRVHLVDDRGHYCGLPETDECRACVKRNGSVAGYEVDVARWRSRHAAFLAGARRVLVPSQDVRRRLAPLLPQASWLLRPHPERYRSAVRAPRRRARRRRRIAVLGAVGPEKGSAVLAACAADAARRTLPLEFRVVGYTDRDEELRATGCVDVSGAYAEEDLSRLIERAGCDLALFPAVWPETHCYVLSAALDHRLYPVCFDLGAIADRVRDLGWGDVLPLGTDPSAINDHLLAVRVPALPHDDLPSRLDVAYDDYLREYYDGLEL